MAKPPKPPALPPNFHIDDVMGYGQKHYGTESIQDRVKRVDTYRAPSGVFPLDYATGGGIPRGRATEIYGAEGMGKTTLALMYMSVMQKLEPENKVAFIDQEHTLTPEWARKVGVDPDKVIYVRPNYAEQAVDMLEKITQARGVSLVCLDSIGSMMTTVEEEKGAEGIVVGNTAIVCSKLARRIPHAMDLAEQAILSGARSAKLPAVICINQVRTKIGVMYGSDEGTPGGQALKHLYGMRLRVYGSNKSDAKLNDSLPIIKSTTIMIKKTKVPILASEAQYDLVINPFKGFHVGDVLDWSMLEGMMKEQNLLKKEKDGWVMCNLKFKLLAEAQSHYYKDTDFRVLLHEAFIQQALDAGEGIIFDTAELVGEEAENAD